MSNNVIHRRRMVFNGVIRQIAEQLPVSVPGKVGEVFPLSTAMLAWKDFLRGEFFPSESSEDVIKRENWNEVLLRIEVWACNRGVVFVNKKEEEKRA